jgi:hypothetical protein
MKMFKDPGYRNSERRASTILIFLLSSFLFFSCNKESLNVEETKALNEFLSHEWFDLRFVKFSDETVPNEARYTFKIEDSKLKHIRETFWSASFGDKHYKDEGEVNVYYDKEKNGIVIELFNDKNELIDDGIIRIDRSEIVNRLTRQTQLRERIKEILKSRKFTELTFNEFDQRGIFESQLQDSYQSEDFEMNYSYELISHLEGLKDFKPLVIEDFYSSAGDGILWQLREFYDDALVGEYGAKNLRSNFSESEIIEILKTLNGNLKFYDSNISTKESFQDEPYSIQVDTDVEFYEEPRFANRYKSEIILPIKGDNFNFLSDWYGNGSNSSGNFEKIELVQEGLSFGMIIRFKGNLNSTDGNWFKIYKVSDTPVSNADTVAYDVAPVKTGSEMPSKLFFFQRNKYFALDKEQ